MTCGSFRRSRVADCAALLVDNAKPADGASRLVLAMDRTRGADRIKLIEDYSRDLVPRTTVFLRPRSAAWIPDRENGGNVLMARDGFEVVFFEKSSQVYYFDDATTLRKVWTSD